MPRISSCFHCGYVSKQKNSLRRHISTWHNGSGKVKPRPFEFSCLMCGLFSSVKREEVIAHYVQIHDVIVSSAVSLEFSTWDEFLSWKASIEQQELSEYTTATISRRKQAIHYYYRCHRDGYYKPRGKGIRKIKIPGTNKINGCCPASMTVRRAFDGNVTVKFISTHVGHKHEVGRLRLPQKDRESLAQRIASKVPLDTILNDIRDSFSSGELKRVHLTQLQDLKNLARDYNLVDECVKHRNDTASVEAWVTEMQQTSSVVRLYKTQGSAAKDYSGLNDNDFVLIIANDTQLEFLATRGKHFICVDGTRGTDAHELEVTTVLTLNDIHEGFPCAFMISSRSDEEIMRIFFSVLKDSLGSESEIQTAVFMSDMADYYYNAWKSVMPCPTRQLYCTWHVDSAWRKDLCKIKVLDKKTYVYWLLRTLLHEPDENAFVRLLKNGLIELESDPDTAEFAAHFREGYVPHSQCWAHCFRKHAGFNCNIQLEDMHNVIKHFYFRGKKVQRLDRAINGVQKFIRDKMFSRIETSHKGHRGKVSTKLRVLRDRHNKSLNVEMLVLRNGKGWDLSSPDGHDLYTISPTSVSNCDCEIRCDICGVCIHEFHCTCIDNSIKWNLCKHIHFLCRVNKEHVLVVAPASPILPDCDTEVREFLVVDFSERDQTRNDEEQVFLKELSRPKDLFCLEEKKAIANTLFEEAFAACSDAEQFKCLIDLLKPAKVRIESLATR